MEPRYGRQSAPKRAKEFQELPFSEQLKEFERLFAICERAKHVHKDGWNRNYPTMGLDYKRTSEYNTNVEEFWRAFGAIDEKIYPVPTDYLDTALAYLAVPTRHFRSGYNKEEICQHLKHVPLKDENKQTIRRIWADVERHLGMREQRKFRQLLVAIDHESM